MPKLTRGLAERELRRLIETFRKAETDIINEISRLRSRGLVDYHVTAALERVQKILRNLEDSCQTYAPRMIEAQFYVHHPEARKPLDPPDTPQKHMRGYQNAWTLTGEQTDIVERLTMNLLGQVAEASSTAYGNLESMLIGRTENDPFRRTGLEQTAAMQAAGGGVWKAAPGFVEALRREGLTAFTDKAGRNWNLHTYGSMVLRTTSRQAEVLSVLTQDPEQDLYMISAHGSTCPLCAPLEGRVYSQSGRDKDFPPLTRAFGKMDPDGPDTLDNSWLNIHPNCLHQIIRWTPAGRSAAEIQKIKDFSSFEKNPVTRDPRTQKQVEAYRQKERDRAKWLRDYRQWEKYRDALGDQVPKTFETFRKHKLLDDEKFQAWKKSLREQNRLAKGGTSGIIQAGGVTGALDPNSHRAEEHADRYYALVRKMTTDVQRISANTGLPQAEIQRIKNFIFMDEHDLGDGRVSRFDASFEMAESWQRLIDGKNIQPHDLTLLRHEMMENSLMEQGYTQDEAHILTSKKYNYKEGCLKYYGSLKKDKKR